MTQEKFDLKKADLAGTRMSSHKTCSSVEAFKVASFSKFEMTLSVHHQPSFQRLCQEESLGDKPCRKFLQTQKFLNITLELSNTPKRPS
jgi:hypothetical protein